MYYRARYYDPSLGQFISPDTIVPDPSNVLDYNRYLYGLGNPLKFSDPSGHAALSGDDYDPADYYQSFDYYRVAYAPPRSPAAHAAQAAAQDSLREQLVKWIGIVPGIDTGEDIAVTTTGCSFACQEGYEEPVGLFWRGVAATGIVGPWGYRSLKGVADSSSIVYRALTPLDKRTIEEGHGLLGRSYPADYVDPVSHVAGAHHSPWISTGKNYDAIRSKYDSGNGIVAIDLSKVDELMVDFSNGIPGYEGTMLSNWSKSDGEILIKNHIPPEAISIID